MATTRTRAKLEEARFFLGKLREGQGDLLVILDRDAWPTSEFLFYLSAFLSAARSVTWVMRSEYVGLEGWEAWFEGEEQLEEEQELLSVFAALRNSSQKEGRLPATPEVTIGDASDSRNEEAAAGKPRYRLTLKGVDKPDFEYSIDAYVEDLVVHTPALGDRDVVDACDRYFRMLELLVRKCERAYPGSPV